MTPNRRRVVVDATDFSHRATRAQMERSRAEAKRDIDSIIDAWPHIAKIANDMQRGYPTRGDASSTTDSGRYSTVEHFALQGAPENPGDPWHTPDDPAAEARQWMADVRKLFAALIKLANDGRRIVEEIERRNAALGNQPAPTRTPGGGDCTACGRYVSGATDDRLRSGYCDACRKAWERAGRPDRAAFENERRTAS